MTLRGADVLTECIRLLEAEAHQVLAAKAAWDAAILLGEEAAAERIAAVVDGAPDEAFTAGVIANFEFGEDVVASWRTLDVEGAEKRRPPFDIQRARSLAGSDEVLLLSWARAYERALALCPEASEPGRTSPAAEVATTAAVLGDFAVVHDLLERRSLDAGSRRMVLVVLAVEAWRRGDVEEADRAWRQVLADNTLWDLAHLALGLAGCEPWGGYPYADY